MLKPGINNCSNSVYHGDRNYVSSSGLKMVLENPYQYYLKYMVPSDGFESVGSPTLDLGSYVHSLILEPELTEGDFAIWDGIRRGPEWKEFEANNKHKTIITLKMSELGKTLYKSVMSNNKIVQLLEGGQSEFTYCAELKGVPVKVRADRINLDKNYILDVKTTSKQLTKEELMVTIANFHYDLSAALYVDCFKQINGVDSMDFYFLFVNTKDTLDSVALKASDALIENGRRKYRKALKKLIQLRKTGIWKPEEIEEIDVPSWALYPQED